MIKAKLTRVESSDQGTFGILEVLGKRFFTGELPDRDNRPNISRIPAGTYQCLWTFSPRFKRKMYLVDHVPNRAGVRQHAANLMGDKDKGYKAQLNGCIALGEKLGWIEGQKAILISAPAIYNFERLLNGQPFELEIVDA